MPTMSPPLPERGRSNSHGPFPDADSPPILSPPQDLPVLRDQCAEDRLQGRAASATLRFRARQDRAEPDHGGFRQEAARARARHQARPLSRLAALRDPLMDD